MKLLFLTLFLLITTITLSQQSGIEFKEFHSFEEAVIKANNERKAIFVEFHYKGCTYCKKMEEEIFTEKIVGDFYNEKFICLSVDINKDSIGKSLSTEYELRCYPAHLFFDSLGRLIHKYCGFQETQDFIETGIIALDPNQNMNYFKTKIYSGVCSADILFKYFSSNIDDSNRDELINSYLNQANHNEKFSFSTWQLLTSNIRAYYSKYFEYIVNNENEFRKNINNSLIDDFLIYHWVFMINRWKIFEIPNEKKRKEMKERLFKKGHQLYDRVIMQADYEMTVKLFKNKKNKKRWNEFIESSKDYFHHVNNDWHNLENTSRIIFNNYEEFNDIESLKLTKSWAQQSMIINKNFYNLDTYACILFAFGEVEKAIEIEKEALKIAKNEKKYKNIKVANTNIDKWTTE